MKKFLIFAAFMLLTVTLVACNEPKTQWVEVNDFVLADNSIYTGWLYQGLPTGEGEIEFEDGAIFAGTFNEGKLVQGVLTYANGDIYTGTFEENKKSGIGYMEYITGAIYHGYFENDAMHGWGYMEWANGDFYHGEWVNGNPNGFGRKEFKNITNGWYIYEGDMKNGLMHGTGKMIYPSDGSFGTYEMYYGSWNEGQRAGAGKFWFRDGSYYEGNFDFDWINGKGKFFWTNGNNFEGEFSSGNIVPDQDGKGTMIFNNDEKYVGDIYINEDGSWVRDGQGIMFFPGTWSAGNSAPEGYNILRFEGTFDKEFNGGWINGSGKLFYVNNSNPEDIIVIEGIFSGFDKVE